MFLSSFLTLAALITSGHVATAKPTPDEVPVYECEMYGQTRCILNNVEVTKEQPNFVAQAPVPSAIISVEFRDSKIPVLTNDLCDAFRNVELLILENLQIEAIADDAFEWCLELKQLVLSDNRIEELPKGVFGYNEKLSGLYLDSNRLVKIREDQFWNNTGLYWIYLQENHLSFFPAAAVKELKNLLGLVLHTNDISDLEETELVTYLPRLRFIGFNNNELACARLSDFLIEFNTNEIQVINDQLPRERFYETLLINDVTCLPDVSWTAALYRKLNQVPESFPRTVRQHFEELMNGEQGSKVQEVEQRLESEIKELEDFVTGEVAEMKKLIMHLAKKKVTKM